MLSHDAEAKVQDVLPRPVLFSDLLMECRMKVQHAAQAALRYWQLHSLHFVGIQICNRTCVTELVQMVLIVNCHSLAELDGETSMPYSMPLANNVLKDLYLS